jgi:hypothetical protein
MAGRVTDAPTITELDKPKTNLWLKEMGNRMNLYSGTANPTSAVIPNNQWIIYKNTSLNEIRIWTNDNGTVKKSAAFT